jgi:predicted O-methyltransferase YrrM
MIKKLGTLLWYLKRPRLYPHLIHLVPKRLSTASSMYNDTRQEASQWCAGLSVDTDRVLQQLTGKPAPAPVEGLFPGYFESAESIAIECPVEMGGPGNLDLLYWSAEYLMASRVIETSVAFGWSSLAILLSLKNRRDSKLISTDMPYPNRNNEPYIGCVVPAEIKSNWRILKYADRQALPRALKILDTIDMCHYDSDKSYDGRMWAYPILWEALRPGGFFISDDINDNVAFREFSSMVACDPIVVEKDDKYAGVLIKPYEKGSSL